MNGEVPFVSVKPTLWLQKQNFRKTILDQTRSKFSIRLERKDVKLDDDHLGILNYYLDARHNSFKTVKETIRKIRRITKASHSAKTSSILFESGISKIIIYFLDENNIAKFYNIENEIPQSIKNNPETISRNDVDSLIYESLLFVDRMVCGTPEEIQYVVSLGCIPKILQILKTKDTMKGKCIQSLANIAVDSPHTRDLILEHEDIFQIISDCIENQTSIGNAIWALSNLMKGTPSPHIKYANMAMPLLSKVLNESSEEEFIIEASWGISNITDFPNDTGFKLVMKSGCIDKIIANLNSNVVAIQDPSLRIIGNIATGDDNDAKLMVDAGLFKAMHELITCRRGAVVRMALRTLSNITLEDMSLMQQFKTAGLIPLVIEAINRARNIPTQNEGYFVIRNMCASFIFSIEELLKFDILAILHRGLSQHTSIVLDALTGFVKPRCEFDLPKVEAEMEKFGTKQILKDLMNMPNLTDKDKENIDFVLDMFKD